MHRLVWLLALTGCSDKAAKAPPPEPSAPIAQQAPTDLSCMGLMTCMVGCTDGDCTQGCLAHASAATQAAATAFLECNASKCASAGADCLATECSAEMTACTGANAVAAAPEAPAQVDETLEFPDQPHTTANLLPWMTGQWIGTNHQFEFFADGRVRRVSGTPEYSEPSGSYQCVSTIEEMGTVRQEGDVLIMRFEPADQAGCGAKHQKAQGLTVRYKITWTKYADLTPILYLIDLDCKKDSMYCNNKMQKR